VLKTVVKTRLKGQYDPKQVLTAHQEQPLNLLYAADLDYVV